MDVRISGQTWSEFLSRWALISALAIVGLLLAFFVGVGFDPAVPQEYAELVQASRHPEAYRVAMLFDVAGWVGIGGLVLGFSGLLWRYAPLRSAFSAACGAGMLTGIIGGLLRLNATSELAGRYATASAGQQAGMVQQYLVLNQIISSHFHAGQLLQLAALFLLASAALSVTGFPRWLGVWLVSLGTLVSVLFVVQAVLGMFLFGLLLVYIVVYLAFNVAVALRFWREAPELKGGPVRV